MSTSTSTSEGIDRTPLSPPPGEGLGAEVRESLLLLSFAVAVTVGITTAAQAALALLG